MDPATASEAVYITSGAGVNAVVRPTALYLGRRTFKLIVTYNISTLPYYLQNISLTNDTRVRMAFCDKSATY